MRLVVALKRDAKTPDMVYRCYLFSGLGKVVCFQALACKAYEH